MSTCKNCKFFVTEDIEPARKAEAPEGWGFCVSKNIRKLDNQWFTASDIAPDKNCIFTTFPPIGRLSSKHQEQGDFAQFIVGENFGCIHFKNKYNFEL